MLAVFAITFIYLFLVWLVFIKLKWLRLTPVWGVVSGFFLIHLIFVPLIGVRFIAPVSNDMVLVRSTVQITPRLEEPTLVTEVLVTEGQKVRKGDPLIRLDRRIYEYQVEEAKAALAEAKQNVKILAADVDVAMQDVVRAEASLAFKVAEAERYARLVQSRAASVEDAQRRDTEVEEAQAALAVAKANVARAQAAYDSQIDGVNTGVLQAEANLRQAQFYLDQTEIRAPDDGMIVNLQVQPGMVAGIVRAGAIASFIFDRDPYLLAMYRQENLLYIEPGQDALVALNLYPGKVFEAKVENIWWASGKGQFTPSGTLPVFRDLPIFPEGRMAVQLTFKELPPNMPIGAQGASLILTDESNPFTWIGQIALRTYAYSRWVYPVPF
jgi:multidrug resistance efflux pump